MHIRVPYSCMSHFAFLGSIILDVLLHFRINVNTIKTRRQHVTIIYSEMSFVTLKSFSLLFAH